MFLKVLIFIIYYDTCSSISQWFTTTTIFVIFINKCVFSWICILFLVLSVFESFRWYLYDTCSSITQWFTTAIIFVVFINECIFSWICIFFFLLPPNPKGIILHCAVVIIFRILNEWINENLIGTIVDLRKIVILKFFSKKFHDQSFGQYIKLLYRTSIHCINFYLLVYWYNSHAKPVWRFLLTHVPPWSSIIPLL